MLDSDDHEHRTGTGQDVSRSTPFFNLLKATPVQRSPFFLLELDLATRSLQKDPSV